MSKWICAVQMEKLERQTDALLCRDFVKLYVIPSNITNWILKKTWGLGLKIWICYIRIVQLVNWFSKNMRSKWVFENL
jgi:hypothetical protein